MLALPLLTVVLYSRLLRVSQPFCLQGFDAFGASKTSSFSSIALEAAPGRYEDNADGVLYVNNRCINCAACAQFAPVTFGLATTQDHHRVTKQPLTKDELNDARAALAACPVAAIRTKNDDTTNSESSVTKRQLAVRGDDNEYPFPRLMVPERYPSVYYLGHHNEETFGAIPYMVQGSKVNVMIDVPKYGPSAIRTVQTLCGDAGPDYMVLTHVDDVADHEKWKAHYPNMKRIFHQGDLGKHNWRNDRSLESVEVLLPLKNISAETLEAWTLQGKNYDLYNCRSGEEFIVLHTDGHSPGSITLLYRPLHTPISNDNTTTTTTTSFAREGGKGVLFTGDTLAYSNRLKSMTGFPRYGDNQKRQAETLLNYLRLPLLGYDWDLIAPGHGLRRHYESTIPTNNSSIDNQEFTRDKEIKHASEELLRWEGEGGNKVLF